MPPPWGLTVTTRYSENFAARVFDRVRPYGEDLSLSHQTRDFSLEKSAVRVSGHPDFNDLRVGESRSCEMVSVFLDLTNFTSRSFWDGAEETARLADGALSGFAYVVGALGGYVLGLRGDGLFAGFGPAVDPRTAAAAALTACAASLDAIESTVNPRLRSEGRSPIQARAGVDFGQTTFIRTGTPEVSEVNVIGFASNFAAKCEKSALSWEVVAGEGLREILSPAALFTHHRDSPKRYTRELQTKSYKFYDVRWRPLVGEVDSSMAELNGRSLAMAGM